MSAEASEQPVMTLESEELFCGGELALRRRGGAAYLVLRRPKRGNALTAAICEAMGAALRRLEADPACRVLVLAAEGKVFCGGMDLKEARSGGGGMKPLVGLFAQLKHFPRPTVCALNGGALGGGAGLACCCDVRVAARGAYLSFPEVRRGLAPAMISTYVVKALGPGLATEAMLTGRRLPAERLHALGVVSELATDSGDALTAAVGGVVEDLLKGAPGAAADIKELVRYVASHSQAECEQYTAKLFAKMMAGEEAAHGLMAFAQKKSPDWDALVRSKL